MIRLDNISNQHGHQFLFIDASMGLRKGEKAGLVGPNGAGKTTLFRMVAGEEQPDDGHVTIDPGPPRLRQPQSHWPFTFHGERRADHGIHPIHCDRH
jgi:ATPase subunit of ABC transporter with duplicated ATPase domains